MNSKEAIFAIIFVVFLASIQFVLAQENSNVGIGATASYQVISYNGTTTSTTTTTTTTTTTETSSTTTTSETTTTTETSTTTTETTTPVGATTETSTTTQTATTEIGVPASPIVAWVIFVGSIVILGEFRWFKKSFGWH